MLAAKLFAIAIRIGNPAIDGGFMPAGAVDADPDLTGKRALCDFSIEGGSGKAGALQDSAQADDTIGFWHGSDSTC
jgi:hypothetical protein